MLYFQEENTTGDKKEEDDEEKMPDYDDATKALIAGKHDINNLEKRILQK